MSRISDLVKEGFKETRATGKELKKATRQLQETTKYHDKKFPVTITARVTKKQAEKLGKNRSKIIRKLIDTL